MHGMLVLVVFTWSSCVILVHPLLKEDPGMQHAGAEKKETVLLTVIFLPILEKEEDKG